MNFQRGASTVARAVVVAFAISIGFNAFGIWRVNDLNRARTRDNRERIEQLKVVTDRLEFLTAEIGRVGNNAILTGCEGRNDLRDAILGFVDSALDRSSAMARAVIDSPTATDEEKRVARENLLRLVDFQNGLHRSLPNEKCAAPLPTG